MAIGEEILVGYTAYRAKVDELEKSKTTERIVFLFEGGDSADSNWDPESTKMVKLLDDVKKQDIHGLLIRIKVTQAEWKDRECKYKIDSKFKVPSLPYAAVFNIKTTLGRNWVHKKIEGEKCQKVEAIANLFTK